MTMLHPHMPADQARRTASPIRITHEDVTLEIATDVVRVNGTPVHLNRRLTQIIRFLGEHAGEVIIRKDLFDLFYGSTENRPASFKSLDVYMTILRERLGPARGFIKTHKGEGYTIPHHSSSAPPPIILYEAEADGDQITIDCNGVVHKNGEHVKLALMQRRYLLLLLKRPPGQVTTPTMFLRDLYPGLQANVCTKLFDVMTCQIRHKIGKAFIEDVWGRGRKLLPITAQPSVPITRKEDQTLIRLVGPEGTRISLKDLPDPNCRWIARRKATVFLLVQGGAITFRELQRMYPDLSHEEFGDWGSMMSRSGVRGLRVIPTNLSNL